MCVLLSVTQNTTPYECFILVDDKADSKALKIDSFNIKSITVLLNPLEHEFNFSII